MIAVSELKLVNNSKLQIQWEQYSDFSLDTYSSFKKVWKFFLRVVFSSSKLTDHSTVLWC